MTYHGAVAEVRVRPSPVAAWFHHLMTTPVVEIDERAHPAKWGTTRIAVTPGTHRIGVYFRYRGQKRARLAETAAEFSVAEASPRVQVTATLGARNGSRFRIEEGGERR